MILTLSSSEQREWRKKKESTQKKEKENMKERPHCFKKKYELKLLEGKDKRTRRSKRSIKHPKFRQVVRFRIDRLVAMK